MDVHGRKTNELHGCYIVRPYSNLWTSTAEKLMNSMDVILYVLIVTYGRPRPHVVLPYRSWLTSTDVRLFALIVTGGRPRPHFVRPYRNC